MARGDPPARAGRPGEPGRPSAGGRPAGSEETERLMNALIVRLDGLAETGQQRDLMRQFHRISVLRALRRAGSALTILQAAARTGLGVYKVESALDSLCADGLAQRDTTRRAWLYHAIDAAEPSAGTAPPAANPSPDAAKAAV